MKTTSLLTLLLLSTCFAFGLGVATGPAQYQEAEILIRFQQGAAEPIIVAFEQEFALSRLARFPSIDAYHYQLPPELSVTAAVRLLSQDERVKVAEPNLIVRECGYDSPHPSQWYLKDLGQNVNGYGIQSVSSNDIAWASAIGRFTTTNSVIVAVLDSGTAKNHEDLAGNIWTNALETLDGQDEDDNGYADDLFGYDFVDQDAQPYDERGHGSQVAGVIAALGDNHLGMVGVCPLARVMTLRILNQQGWGSMANIFPALEYARNMGAKIVNCSFAHSGYSLLERDAYATLRDAGMLVVCAAGNEASNNDQIPCYPASYNLTNMITVAAVDRDLGLASFSNSGVNSVQIGAPGTEMYMPDIARVEIFREDFQTGMHDWSGGGASGSYAWQTLTSDFNAYLSDGSWSELYEDRELYHPGTDTWIRSPQTSLAGFSGCQLSFSAAYDLADDRLWIEASTDLDSWTSLGWVEGSSYMKWGRVVRGLSAWDGQEVYLRFHLVSNGSRQGNGVSIDDLSITRRADSFDGPCTDYTYASGTSFAAPVVSGVAALVLAQRPDMPCGKVRSLLLSNTRSVSALGGKVSTGGIVDANKVMAALEALPVGSLVPVIKVGPTNQTVAEGDSVGFSVAAEGPGPLYYQWLRDGQPIVSATGASYFIAKVQLQHSGDYAVLVRNAHGSVTSAAARLNVGANGITGVVGAPFNYQIVADNEPTWYSASGLPNGLTCDGGTGVISGTPTRAGAFTVRVQARNRYQTVEATLLILIKEGKITGATSLEAVIGASFSYTITADNSPTWHSASGLPRGLTCDGKSGEISGTPAALGVFWIRVEARNTFGTASTTIPLTVRAASIESARFGVGIVGVLSGYQILADNEPTWFEASGLPSGWSCDGSTGLIWGTPREPGMHRISVEAKNRFGSAYASILFLFVDGSITSPFSAEGVVGVPFEYQIEADNEPTWFSASGLPAGFQCDGSSGVISGVPKETGTFQVRVEAKNHFGSATDTIVMTFVDGSITSASSADGVVGVSFSYQITADNEPTWYSVSGLPSGWVCGGRSGTVTGIPREAGTFWLRVEAKNLYGTALASIPVTITDGTISAPSLTISRNGDHLVLSWPVSAEGFRLEEAQSQQGIWTNCPAEVQAQGTVKSASIPLQNTLKFYRLRK